METSTFEIGDLLLLATIGFSLMSAVIVVWFLAAHPPFDFTTKLRLFFGIFLFPILAAGSGNVAGFEATKKRDFCGGCHVMLPYTDDAENPNSTSLASLHARNRAFGAMNCYECHADYGMYGTVTTKIDGLVHAAHYYLEYSDVLPEDTFGRIHLYKPYDNDTCTKCHSMKLPGFNELEDHRGAIEEIEAKTISCVSEGCHGFAHPFSKKAVKP